MKNRRFIISAAAAAVILLMASIALAVPGVIVVYDETDLGGGSWQYDYTFYNTSTEGEALHEMYFYFTGMFQSQAHLFRLDGMGSLGQDRISYHT